MEESSISQRRQLYEGFEGLNAAQRRFLELLQHQRVGDERGRNPWLKAELQLETPRGENVESWGCCWTPKQPEVHKPKLRATPVPRCVMDMAMGSDHLQKKQFVSKMGRRELQDEAQLRVPGQPCSAGWGFCTQLSQESGLRERGETGECAEAAREWQTAQRWEGHLLRKLQGRGAVGTLELGVGKPPDSRRRSHTKPYL